MRHWVVAAAVALGVSLAAAPVQASSVSCCTVFVDDGFEGWEATGVTYSSDRQRGDDVTVRVTPASVVIRNRASRITGNCAARTPHEAVCKMPPAWRANPAGRRIEIGGSERPDRLRIVPFRNGFGASVLLFGYAGNDTLVGALGITSRYGTSGFNLLGGSGRDRLLLTPDGPRVGDHLLHRANGLLLDLWPSRQFAGKTLRFVVQEGGWESEFATFARGQAIVPSTRRSRVRLALTKAGRGVGWEVPGSSVELLITGRGLNARLGELPVVE